MAEQPVIIAQIPDGDGYLFIMTGADSAPIMEEWLSENPGVGLQLGEISDEIVDIPNRKIKGRVYHYDVVASTEEAAVLFKLRWA